MWCGHVLLNSMLLSVLTLLVQMSLLRLDDGRLAGPAHLCGLGVAVQCCAGEAKKKVTGWQSLSAPIACRNDEGGPLFSSPAQPGPAGC